MSAKYLYTIADENPNLHKQLGCMNGLFQIFNCQNFVTGRRIRSHNRKRLPQGESSNPGKEPETSVGHKAIETNIKENVKEGERTSLESSESSFSSSSCSSTFSSIDFKKLPQPDLLISRHATPSKTPDVVPKKQPDPCFKSNQRSPDAAKIIKDSTQRESLELSLKTKTKTEGKNCALKHIDSPRPQQVKLASPRISVHDVPSPVLGRERNSMVLPKDAPRFSYDERESREKWKSVAKLREIPRFSLDSRESSMKRVNCEPRSSSLLENLEQRSEQRLSSIVAKLMGLETFPNPTDTIKSKPHETHDLVSISSRKVDENKCNQISNSPRLTPGNASSPTLMNNSSVKPSHRFPLEPAPLKQTTENQESKNSAVESHLRPQVLRSSVYGQIEKRLTTLEFKKSDKDLRALKQILAAMEKARESIENKGESSYKQSYVGTNTPSPVTTPTVKESNSPKKPSRMVTPAKLEHKPKISISSSLPIEDASGLRRLRTRESADTKKELVPRENQSRKSRQKSPRLVDKRIPAATYTSKQTSVSLRKQQKKHGEERQYNINTYTSEASTPRKAVNQHHKETLSPDSKLKPKLRVWQQGNEDRLGGVSSEIRCLSHQRDAFSAHSGSNISTSSQNDEVRGNYRSDVAAGFNEFRSKTWMTLATLEQPSPVSVLDTTLYAKELPSPVKKISTAFRDEEYYSSDGAESYLVDAINFVNRTSPDLARKLDFGNMENIKHLNNKFQKMDPHDETNVNSITSLRERTDPTRIYVAEILSASGLSKDLGSSSIFSQLSPLEHLINPHLFHILEQAKSMTEVEDDQESKGRTNQTIHYPKIHRKLVFDTADEILVRLFISAGFSDPIISSKKLGYRSLTGEKLLEKICSEINLQTNPEHNLSYEDDVIHSEIPGIVLDIERLIFKDLICETVHGEASLPSRLNKPCRQLFTN